MNLGLLIEVLTDRVTLKEQPQYVSFHHKSLQGYSASKHIVFSLETAKDAKVIIFCDSKTLASHIIAVSVNFVVWFSFIFRYLFSGYFFEFLSALGSTSKNTKKFSFSHMVSCQIQLLYWTTPTTCIWRGC